MVLSSFVQEGSMSMKRAGAAVAALAAVLLVVFLLLVALMPRLTDPTFY
jgi:hypothetical protein